MTPGWSADTPNSCYTPLEHRPEHISEYSCCERGRCRGAVPHNGLHPLMFGRMPWLLAQERKQKEPCLPRASPRATGMCRLQPCREAGRCSHGGCTSQRCSTLLAQGCGGVDTVTGDNIRPSARKVHGRDSGLPSDDACPGSSTTRFDRKWPSPRAGWSGPQRWRKRRPNCPLLVSTQ